MPTPQSEDNQVVRTPVVEATGGHLLDESRDLPENLHPFYFPPALVLWPIDLYLLIHRTLFATFVRALRPFRFPINVDFQIGHTTGPTSD